MDNETRALLRRIERLEREVIALRKRVGNMPIRLSAGGGGGTQSVLFGVYDYLLPPATEAWEAEDGGLGYLAYLRATKAFYRLVEGPKWAAVTLPRVGAWASAGDDGRTGVRTGEMYAAPGARGDDLYFMFGAASGNYPDSAGCLSSMIVPGVDDTPES
jgi:hypothetical protein